MVVEVNEEVVESRFGRSHGVVTLRDTLPRQRFKASRL